MAQHDYVIANQSGAGFRSDLNNGLSAIVSQNSGSAAPSTTYAYMWWADTTTGLLKIRNAANNAWVTVGTLATTNLGLAPLASPTFTGTVTAPTFTASTGVNIPLGSAASPSLYFTGDPNTGIYSSAANNLTFSVGGVQRFGIDTAAVTSTLPIVYPLGAVGTPSITFTGDLNTGIYSPAADTLAFVEGGAEAMRIDSGSRLLVGTSSSITNRVAAGLQVVGTAADAYISATRYSSVAGEAPGIVLGRSKSATQGTNTIVANGDLLGELSFSGANGTTFDAAASITVLVDGTPGATTDMPGRLVFSTSPDGSATPAERFRIGSAGQLGIGGATYGTSGHVLTSGGASAAPTWAAAPGTITSGTAVASTSGTSIDFTSIPAGVKRVTVMFSGVSTSGTSLIHIRLGTSSGVEATNYLGSSQDPANSAVYSTGFALAPNNLAADILHGQWIFSLLNATNYIWAESHFIGRSNNNLVAFGAGSKTLSGTLDRVRITTVNGTDTFDAGSINIMYES
jgi:hypothetical protein